MKFELKFKDMNVPECTFIKKKYIVTINNSSKTRAKIWERPDGSHSIDYGGIGYKVASFEDAKNHCENWFSSLFQTMGL